MVAALWVHALVLAVGVVICLLLWPRMRLVSPAFWGRVLLLGPLGICLQFLGQAALGVPFGVGGVVWAWGALGGLALLLRFWRGTEPKEALPRSSLLLFVVGVLLFALSLGRSLRQPIHEGDALTNFALPARVFAEAEGVDFTGLQDFGFYGHVEYPPLLAASEALVFQEAGDEAFLWNQIFGPLALLALFLLLAGQWFGQDPLPRPYAWLALSIVMGTPMVLFHGCLATADLRLLAAFLLLGIEAQRRGTPLLLLSLGLLCALTKQEGVLGLLVVAVLLWRRRNEWGSSAWGRARVLWAGLGATLMFGLWPALLMSHGLSPFGGSTLGLGLQNLRTKLSALAGFVWAISTRPLRLEGGWWEGFGGEWLPLWGLLWVFVLFVVLAFAVQRMSGKKRRVSAGAGNSAGMGGFFLGLFLLHLALFFLVFLLTPREVQWHLATAGDRFLLVTLAWPLLLLPQVLGRRDATSS